MSQQYITINVINFAQSSQHKNQSSCSWICPSGGLPAFTSTFYFKVNSLTKSIQFRVSVMGVASRGQLPPRARTLAPPDKKSWLGP